MIILLHGSDSYRIQQKLNKYKQKFLRDIDPSGVNIEILEGKEVTVESFHKAVLSGGLFVKKRMVIIKNLFSDCQDENVFKEIKNFVKKNEEVINLTVIFVEIEPNRSTLKPQTVSSSSANTAMSQAGDSSSQAVRPKTPSISSRLFKTLQKQKFSEQFQPLTGIALSSWVKKAVENRGAKISPQAVQCLASNLGSDLWQVSNEIDKLIAYKGGEEIQKDDIDLLVKADLDKNIFNLTDAFGRQDKKNALRLFSEQLSTRAQFPYLLIMLARQIKILLQIKSKLGVDSNQYSLARELGLHPFVVQKSIPQARNFTFDNLKDIYARLLEIDLKAKTSDIDPEVLFDLLIVSK